MHLVLFTLVVNLTHVKHMTLMIFDKILSDSLISTRIRSETVHYTTHNRDQVSQAISKY